MRTLSFDLRNSRASTGTSPTATMRGAGVSLTVHTLGISALMLAPLLGATQLPETTDAFQAPLVLPITVSLPPPPMVAARPPRGPRSAPAAQSAIPDLVPPQVENEPAFLVNKNAVDPVPGIPSDQPATTLAPGSVIGSDCVLGALCGSGPLAPPDKEPARLARVGGLIREPRLIEGRPPQYPPLAQAGGVAGKVVVEAHVADDGRVRDTKVVKGDALFIEAALTSVRSRRYEPLLLNGVPTAFLVTVSVVFNIRR